MDFSVSEQDHELLDAVDRFISRHLPPAEVRRRDEQHIPPYDLLPKMGELGLFALPLPTGYGGLGAQWSTIALIQERLGRHAYMIASIFNRVVGFGAMSLLSYGSEDQKQSMLPELAAGRLLIALALTEQGAGSDASAIVTRAIPTQDGWRLRGRKVWISDAERANYLLVAARSPGTEGTKGISLFLVPPASPGISMTPLPKVGNNCMPSFDIGFDDVIVPSDALLGKPGEGFANLMSTLHYSRASMAATVTGCAQAAVELAISHAKERRQFGRSIGTFQAIRFRLADMQMRVDQSHLTMLHLAWMISQSQDCRRQAAQAKVIATEALQYVTHHGMQILASTGYATESDMQRYWRDARLYTFGEGTNEIQRELIARQLGLSPK